MSEAANRGKGGRSGDAPKKSGGFWSSLVESFVSGLSIDARQSPVAEERKEAGEEIQFRTSDGAQGRPPMQRIERQRQQIARSIDARSAPAPVRAPIPQHGGAPLPKDARSRMEPRLGADLADVRVHTGAESAAAAQGLGARAFAVGSDVHFNAGQFSPGSKEGDKLLAHELTHVVQAQKSGIQRKAEDAHDQAGGGEHGAQEVSHPNDPAEKEADAVAEGVAEGLHGDPAAKAAKPAAKLEGVGRKIFRVPSISARPPLISRMANEQPSTAGMVGAHDGLRKEIANADKIWNKTKVQDKLRKSPTEKTALEAHKTKLESSYQAKEADFTRLKGKPTRTECDTLRATYLELSREASTLRQDLEDYTKTVEQIAEESATLRLEIRGSLERAKKQVPDVEAIKVLQLPSFTKQKQKLVDLFAKVDAGAKLALDEKLEPPTRLPELRKLHTDADELRRKAEEGSKLNDVNNAIVDPVKKIDNIVHNTTKAGRPDAGAGDGSSEAAAIEEAKTGQPTKGVFHGPKCNQEKNALAEPISTLQEIRTTTTDPEMLKKIDAEIQRAKTRQTALQTGADAWKNSSHFKKAPF